MKPIESLLDATEDDVIEALRVASFGNWPQDEADLLEFFILMIDTRLGGTPLSPSDTGLAEGVNFRCSDH